MRQWFIVALLASLGTACTLAPSPHQPPLADILELDCLDGVQPGAECTVQFLLRNRTSRDIELTGVSGSIGVSGSELGTFTFTGDDVIRPRRELVLEISLTVLAGSAQHSLSQLDAFRLGRMSYALTGEIFHQPGVAPTPFGTFGMLEASPGKKGQFR